MNTSKEAMHRRTERSPTTRAAGGFKSRVSSVAAETLHSFMVTGDSSMLPFRSKKHSAGRGDTEPPMMPEAQKVYLSGKRRSQYLSATSITKLLLPGHK